MSCETCILHAVTTDMMIDVMACARGSCVVGLASWAGGVRVALTGGDFISSGSQ